jgi:signal transduction histidine kinase
MNVRSAAPRGVLESDLVAPPVSRRSAQVLSRFTIREHGPAFWIALWTLAAAAEFGALVPVIFGRDEPVPGWEVVYRLIGGSFAACGLIAWRRRPDSRSGVLMTAVGFGFYLFPLLSQVDAPVAVTLSMLVNDYWTIPFVALLLTFVTGGRLRSRVDVGLLWLFVVPLVILEFVWLLFREEEGNVLVAFPNEGIADAIDTVQRSLVLAGCLGVVGVVAARFRAASPPRRRALLPSVAGGIALLLFASLLANDLLGTGTRAPLHLWVTIASLALVPAAFLAGLLRSRLARAGLAPLFRGLRAMRGPELQAALARTMGDPGLVVARRAPDGRGYVDASGHPVAMPTSAADRRIVPVQRDGHEIAALVYDASLDDDPELVEAVSAAAAIALENEHLHRESEARLAELQASRERLVAASDAERRRLERDLHDGAQQRLVALAMQLRFLQSRIREDPATAEELATTASAQLAESLEELRDLARGIHPAVLDHGLETALESLAGRAPVPTSLRYDTTARLPPAVQLAAYFVVSEALTNVAKYARATTASVSVSEAAGRLRVEVADDGIGGAAAAGGSGLRGLADRVEALDGRLSVVSPPAAGTTVVAELPCGS